MENVIEALMNYIDNGEITKNHLKYLNFGAFKNFIEKNTPTSKEESLKKSVCNYEKKLILEVLESTGGNVTRAAEKLKMKRQLLQYYMKKYNISREDVV